MMGADTQNVNKKLNQTIVHATSNVPYTSVK